MGVSDLEERGVAMSEAYIIDAVRTPRGKRKGSLSLMHPVDLAAAPLKALAERNPNIPVKDIEDVVYGCVTQTGEQGTDIARSAVLSAGWPIEVSGVTLNRFCGSGQQACNFSAQAVMVRITGFNSNNYYGTNNR